MNGGTFEIHAQPDDITCGPTCLHAVYRHFAAGSGDAAPTLQSVIDEVEPLPDGGTLAVALANHALARGLDATIYTYNLQIFDPTWFDGGEARGDLAALLAAQASQKSNAKLRDACARYQRFLGLGGRLRQDDLGPDLLTRLLADGAPVLTGLSATWLYGCARERGAHKTFFDDVGGEPAGHFVVLHGIDTERGVVDVADPLHDNPRWGRKIYAAPLQRVLTAILLGIMTYDANLLVLRPRGGAGADGDDAPAAEANEKP